MEKRFPLAMPLFLLSSKDLNATDMVITENVSRHGARVLSNQHWQPGQHEWITTMSGKFWLAVQVVYCQKTRDNQYGVGLKFQAHAVRWSEEGVARDE